MRRNHAHTHHIHATASHSNLPKVVGVVEQRNMMTILKRFLVVVLMAAERSNRTMTKRQRQQQLLLRKQRRIHNQKQVLIENRLRGDN